LLGALRLIAAQGNDVWPGWGDSVSPVLLWDGDHDWLVGHPSPPGQFEIVQAAAGRGFAVAVSEGHITPAPVATTWLVGGRWAAALPSRAEFQQLVDAAFGKGTVVFDFLTYRRVAFHELFHAFQMTSCGGSGGMPPFVSEPDPGEALAERRGSAAWREGMVAEGRLLCSALEAGDRGAALAAARLFLAARERRRAGYPDALRRYEDGVEWIEGLARYAELRMAASAAASAGAEEGEGRGAADVDALDSATGEILKCLGDLSIITTGERDWHAALGAGIAMALDLLAPGWKEGFLASGHSLGALALKRCGE